MLHFFGNCQTAFLCDAMARRGHNVQMNTLATPITAPKADGRIPEELADRIMESRVENFLLDRSLACQFQILDDTEADPEVAVFNLFHEATPLFGHKKDDYIFFIDPEAMEHSEQFGRWVRENCSLIKVNPETYLARFANMVEWFRKRRPGTPIVILTRLSHFPMFGPHPHSYLECWETAWRQAAPLIEQWAAGLPDCHVINLDRVFGGIWEVEGQSIETHCPFLRIRLPEEQENGRLSIRRDLEHIGPMWEALARTMESFLETGQVRYAPEERPKLEWLQQEFRPEILDRDGLAALLQSGGNYQAARAVGSFFWRPNEDFSKFLATRGQEMPICHNTLHMVRKYAGIKKNPALLPWIDSQQERLQQFSDQGPAFRQRYADALEDMREELKKSRKIRNFPTCACSPR